MKTLEIDLAGGGDNTVDPRVAPSGTISRAVNLRLDRQGRLVPRNGYASLGVSVQGSGGSMFPLDLHNVDGTLVALGNNAAAQTGIRFPYRYMAQNGNPTQGIWRYENETTFASLGATDTALPCADNVRVLQSEATTCQTDVNVCDCAVSSDGAYVCMVSVDQTNILTTQFTRIVVIDCATELIVAAFNRTGEANPRVLALPTTGQFRVFTQNIATNDINAFTLDPSASVMQLSAGSVVASAGTAYPGPYDVANFGTSSDWLIVFATGTGYTWRRFNAAQVQQTTTNAVDLANAAVSICGFPGETISVLNVRAVSGVNIRTFATSGALNVGPTNIDTDVLVYAWVSVVRLDAATVQCRFLTEASILNQFTRTTFVTTAAHVLSTLSRRVGVRPTTKTCQIDGQGFALDTLGAVSPPAPYGILGYPVTLIGNQEVLHGTMLDGIAKTTYSAATAWQQSSLVQRPGTREIYGSVITKDPRDKTFRANLVRFEWNSSKRRQGVTASGILYLAGGSAMQYDLRTASALGFETQPAILGPSHSTIGGGALTALGTYILQCVFRSISSTGEVTQSAPSDPVTVTLTGADNGISFQILSPYGFRAQTFIDVYRTEAGGTIPRLSQSKLLSASGYNNIAEINADSVVQTGAPLYTQGADGTVSGRLPLGEASPCSLLMEAGGKLHLAGLERPTQLELSIEKRPGETIGFVNDDLFFVDNAEKLVAVAASADGRRYLFGARTVRELVGEGPNAAGADATLIEPVLVEPTLGCVDWRSVAVTAMGVFFQSSRAPDPKIYLIPLGGGQAVLASEGIRDTLRDYPVITSVTYLEQEQLLTFTLQNTAGNDGRIVHLDLTSSGLSQRGFVGRWFIDRLPQVEGTPEIEIVEERFTTFPSSLLGFFILPLPAAKRVGDRIMLYVSLSAASTASIFATPAGFTQVGVVTAGSVSQRQMFVYEQIVTSATQAATQTSASFTFAQLTSVIVRTVLLRGCHGSQASEMVSATTGAATALTPGPMTLTPTWGSAQNLWYSMALSAAGTAPSGVTQWRTTPTGFVDIEEARQPTGSQMAVAAGSQVLTATSIAAASWASPNNNLCLSVLVATRPLNPAGTPVRASVQFGGRLIVCNDSAVIRNDSNAIADISAAFIATELELADLYPMGAGGAGRHMALVFVGELLGFCQFNCALSYDEGRNWTALQSYLLSTTNGFSVGQTLRLLWVPKRRKINGVRARFSVSENTIDLPLAGDTPGVAMQRAFFQFDELLGPSRMQPSQRK